jgi:hypothetical protein
MELLQPSIIVRLLHHNLGLPYLVLMLLYIFWKSKIYDSSELSVGVTAISGNISYICINLTTNFGKSTMIDQLHSLELE